MHPRPARPSALLLAGLVLAAACSTAADRAVDATSTTTDPATAPEAPTLPAAPSEGAAAGTSGQATAPSDAPGAPDAPLVAPSAAAGRSPTPGEAPVDIAAGPVGSMAVRYLAPSASERVLVQVLAQDGAAPRAAGPERIRQVLAGVSGKPVSLATARLGGGARSWTSEDLRALADASSPAQSAEQAVLTLLFLDGGFAESDRSAGVAVRGDVAAVFAERVSEASGMLGDRSTVEDAVTMHEVGHLLGLVDLVVDTGRQDPENPGHSPNQGSVMYYAVESTLLGSLLSGGPPRDFDQADLDDLARIRNG